LRGIIETVQHDKTIQPPCRLGTTVSVASGDTFSFRSKVNTLKPRCARKEKQISLWLKENQSHAFRFPFDVLFLFSV
jgi:hypothetical protein